MNNPTQWLSDFSVAENLAVTEGIVPVRGYDKLGLSIEEMAVMEKAEQYKADAVFFEASRDGKPSVPQVFLYRSDGPPEDLDFAERHRQLWSWGGVPLMYRVTRGQVQLFRCAHRPDFERGGKIVFNPVETLKLASRIAQDPWWDADQLRSGALWDDPSVCSHLLSSTQAAQKTLIKSVEALYRELSAKNILPQSLRRRLLILSILVTYLEQRRVFEKDFFANFLPDADRFFQVLADGKALISLLDQLEMRFNGHVFVLSDADRVLLLEHNNQLASYADLVEARKAPGGQLTLWERYSFADLPVELISHIYQLFVEDKSVAVYTPHFVVRLMLDEALSWDRLTHLEENDEVILDPACGSGIFLVEAYKRLVLHWRSRHNWETPNIATLQELLLKRLRGIDKEEGAVELAAFSLCLALCDALEPIEIRTSVRLFPQLKENTIHTGCFFEACEKQAIKESIGVIIGNPPFTSKLETEGAQRAYQLYQQEHGSLPDKQLAYLFLHKSMDILAPGGILAMLQEYNFLYNQGPREFRRKFFERWYVREILDFISIRGLFQKSGSDTKVIVVVAEAQKPTPGCQILHATFRRSGRADAEQGFDIDYYDMHWLQRELVLSNDNVWRCDLLGGGRVLSFMDRLREYRTLESLSNESEWEKGEGWIVGNANDPHPFEHIIGEDMITADALADCELVPSLFGRVPNKNYQWPRRREIYTSPLLLIHKHENLSFGTWSKGYLTYPHTIVGFSAASGNKENLRNAASWLRSHKQVLQAVIALSGTVAFASKATAVLSGDILQLPFPEDWDLDISPHELILIEDIVDYYRDFIRLGNESAVMKESGVPALPVFNDIFVGRINGVYKENQLHPLKEHTWPGVICQPYVFGVGEIDWTGADELKGKLDRLLREKRGTSLNITRIARIYDGSCIYLLKPDRLRYWMRSIALRDADETLADLAEQGF